MYVKGYGFLSFAKNMSKNLRNKHGKKRLDSAKKSAKDVCFNKNNLKISTSNWHLIGKKIVDKITHSKNVQQSCTLENYKTMKWRNQKKDTYLQKTRQQIIDELRLV